MTAEIIVLLLLFTKHFVVDFPLQTRYQWSNKGTYLHPGGILHAGLHGACTFVCILIVSAPFAALFGIMDFVIHYHIDWLKVNLNKKLGWQPNTHEQFWWLLGLDQFLHSLTYIAFAASINNTFWD